MCHPRAETMSVIQVVYVNRFVSHHICLLCTPTNACAYTLGMAFARADWCLSSYYKFMAVGEVQTWINRVYEMKRENPIQNRKETRENIERRKGKCSGVKSIIDKIALIRSISKKHLI